MDNEARILLDDVIEFCRRDGREARLVNMLEQCQAVSFDDESLTIAVPSRFACTYLERQREIVEAYLEEVSFMPMRLEVSLEERAGAASGHAGASASARICAAGPASATATDSEAKVKPAQSETPEAIDGENAPSLRESLLRQDEPLPATQSAAGEAPAPRHELDRAGAGEGTQKGSINVVNTVSAEAFRKMMQEMNGGAPTPAKHASAGAGAPAHRGVTGTAANTDVAAPAPSVDINAKYTFESFVAGDENRHAFNSAMRFAAYAEEPGQCPSLFIYGNSGLGKTHLLFAVRNYLAKEKPYIRVKYANSQAYLDDYMNELGSQRGPGSLIMREYRDADILIIDDVQNIVGKQASVEFFFQLVDGFIREGKKIAFASDRAPKDLAMDERLTSRFSRGMLCLVSEPGFEMKYIILKRYYESIISAADTPEGMNVDTSLLSMLPERQGHLTDEHLRHMAEISGNNIRNLESFCERCAGLAAEREAAGGGLSAADIDETAKTYFNTARKTIHIDTVQRVVEEFYHVSHEELIGPRRTANIAFARHVGVYLANSLCEMTTPAIGAEFGGRDHSTVLNSLKVVENKMREDRRIYEDLQNLKNTIMLKS